MSGNGPADAASSQAVPLTQGAQAPMAPDMLSSITGQSSAGGPLGASVGDPMSPAAGAGSPDAAAIVGGLNTTAGPSVAPTTQGGSSAFSSIMDALKKAQAGPDANAPQPSGLGQRVLKLATDPLRQRLSYDLGGGGQAGANYRAARTQAMIAASGSAAGGAAQASAASLGGGGGARPSAPSLLGNPQFPGGVTPAGARTLASRLPAGFETWPPAVQQQWLSAHPDVAAQMNPNTGSPPNG